MELDWTTFVLELFNFVVLIWILKRFLYQPVLDVIERRRLNIENTLAEADNRQREANALREQYEQRLADWEQDHDQLIGIRSQVFVAEQQVPIEEEIDGLDADCIHVAAILDNQWVGTARMLPTYYIGRMCVLGRRQNPGGSGGSQIGRASIRLPHRKNKGRGGRDAFRRRSERIPVECTGEVSGRSGIVAAGSGG